MILKILLFLPLFTVNATAPTTNKVVSTVQFNSCIEKCWFFYNKSLLPREYGYPGSPSFETFPFIPELTKNQTEYGKFCKIIQNFENCSLKCGIQEKSTPPKAPNPSSHFLCHHRQLVKNGAEGFYPLFQCAQESISSNVTSQSLAEFCYTAQYIMKSCFPLLHGTNEAKAAQILETYYGFYAEAKLTPMLGLQVKHFPHECEPLLRQRLYGNASTFVEGQQNYSCIIQKGQSSLPLCQCVRTGQNDLLNLTCIRFCYEGCVQPHPVANKATLSCDIGLCGRQIANSLFKNKDLSLWFPVVPIERNSTSSKFQIRISKAALDDLTLHSKLEFSVTYIVLNLNNKFQKTKILIPETLLQESQHLTYINRSSFYKLQNRTRLHKSNRHSYFWLPNKWLGSEKNAMIIHIVFAGELRNTMYYVPQSLKRTYPPKLPEPPSHINLDILYYSEHNSQLKVCWNSPHKWNGVPLGYTLVCSTWPPYNSSSSAHENDIIYELSINWKQLCQDIWITVHFGELIECKVNAINSNGASNWSKRIMSPIEYQSIFIHIVDFETFESKTNLWKYRSIAMGDHNLSPATNKIPLVSDLPGTICSHHNETFLLQVQGNINPIGCCDWISQKYYTAINKSIGGSIWIAAIDIRDKNLVTNQDLFQYLIQIDQIPYEMLCYPLLSTLVWSQERMGEISFKRLHLTEPTVESIAIIENCPELQNGMVLSPAIAFNHVTDAYLDDGTLTPDGSFIVQTSIGLWSVSFNDKKCQRLTSALNRRKIKHMNQIYFRMWAIKSNSTVFPYISTTLIIIFDKSNSSAYFKYYKVMNSGRNFTIGHQQNIINYYREISLRELQFVPTYPALVSILNTNPIKRFWSRREFQFPLPINCIYPNATVASTNTESDHVTQLLIVVLWDRSEECKIMSRPKLDIEVKYRPRKEEDSNTTSVCYGIDCSCYDNRKCSIWKSQNPTYLSQFQVPLVDLESDIWFYVEIAIYPSLGNYPKLWYGNTIHHRIFRTVFLNHFEPPKLVRTVLYSVTPVFTLLVIVSALLAYLYRTKWYIYQHIQRITKSQITWSDNEKLGEGYFSEVYKATITFARRKYCGLPFINDSSCHDVVAVKVLKSTTTEAGKKSFLEEAILMSQLKNKNIIHPMGICMDSKPRMLALEFMNGGSLNKYLQKEETQKVLLPIDLWQICADVADACLYLEENNIIHRDLSAKNCLVRLKSSGRPDVVKIGDFGLAKDVHRYHKYETSNTLFPRQFTAPEGFEGNFTSRSDSWSYGVVMWEVFSWGAVPYECCALHLPGHPLCPITKPLSNSEIETFVCTEMKTLKDWASKPCAGNFPNAVNDLMVACWAFKPALRLQFDQIRARLDQLKVDISSIELEKPSEYTETVLQHVDY